MNSKNISTSLRVRVPPSTSYPGSNHVLSRNLEQPPDNSIDTPKPLLKFGRVVFLIFCSLLIGILVNGMVHESIHWYRVSKTGLEVEDVCFMGLGRHPDDDDKLGSMAGWVTAIIDRELSEKEDVYIRDEIVPTSSGIVAGVASSVIVFFMFI